MAQLTPPDDGSMERPIELEDIRVLRAELQELRKDCGQLDSELRSSRRSLNSAKVRHGELKKKVQLREAENNRISEKLGSADQAFMELQEWRQKAKQQVQQVKELQEGIETERRDSDARIAELQEIVARKGTPQTAKALEAEETRKRRAELDDQCGRLQILRDFIRGSLPPMETSELHELLKSEDAEENSSSPSPEVLDASADQIIGELQQQHDKFIKELVDKFNSIIDKKNHNLKRINKGLFMSSLLRPERSSLQEHPTIREILDDAAALCRVRSTQNARFDPKERRINGSESEGESSEPIDAE